jgi:hypothetical protein
MSVPTTIQQLFIVLVAVLPGVVYQTVRARLVGPSPHNSEGSARLLRAISASVVFDAIYVVSFGPWLVSTAHAASVGQPHWQSNLRDLAGAAAALVLVGPAAVAAILALLGKDIRIREPIIHLLERREANKSASGQARTWTVALRDRLQKLGYEPTLTWDFAFTGREPCYVRIFSKSDRWIGGYFGPSSFVASYPESPAIYLEEAWLLDDDGKFESAVDGTRGMYVPCSDVLTLEFLRAEDGDAEGDDDAESVDTESQAPKQAQGGSGR